MKFIVAFSQFFADAHENGLKEVIYCKSDSKHCLHKQAEASVHFSQKAL